MWYYVKVVESREFIVTYRVDSALERACTEDLVGMGDVSYEIGCRQLEDSTTQLFIDKIEDEHGAELPIPVQRTKLSYTPAPQPMVFAFRIWTFANDSYEDPLLEAWVNGFETTEPGKQPCTEWALQALAYVAPVKAFDLDITKCWQIVGKAKLSEALQSPHALEAAEDQLEILCYEKREVPLTYHYPENETA